MSNDKTLSIKVQTTRGTKEFAFSKVTKVSEVIAEVLPAFGFAAGDRFELVLATSPGEPLQPDRPLVSYQVNDGMVVVLTAVGGGV
jgi:hypothetical protein